MLTAKHTTITTAEKNGLNLDSHKESMQEFGWTLHHRDCQNDECGIVSAYVDSELHTTTWYAMVVKCECGGKFGEIYGTEVNTEIQCPHCNTWYTDEDVNIEINNKLLAKNTRHYN